MLYKIIIKLKTCYTKSRQRNVIFYIKILVIIESFSFILIEFSTKTIVKTENLKAKSQAWFQTFCNTFLKFYFDLHTFSKFQSEMIIFYKTRKNFLPILSPPSSFCANIFTLSRFHISCYRYRESIFTLLMFFERRQKC